MHPSRDKPTDAAPRERYVLIIEPLPRSTPGITRVRKLLKAMLRSIGLRCIECRPVETDREGK